jgi:hypothetical protein
MFYVLVQIKFESQEFRDAIRQAGVTSSPEVKYLDEVGQLSV